MQFERTITIRSSPEIVWDHLTDFKKAKSWNDCLIENKQISEGNIGKGFISKTLIKEGKKNVWYEEEIVDFIPFKKIKLKLSGKNLGKNPMFTTYHLKKIEKEIVLTQSLEWNPSGILLKLLHRLIEKMSIKNVEGDLRKLKAHLEN